MGARGRPSADHKITKPVLVKGDFGKARPPEGLTPEQIKIWEETVASEPTDTFGTAATRAALKDYCRHRAEADRISGIINSFETNWLKTEEGCKRYGALSRAREVEATAAIRTARALRLTNQSRYTPHGAATASRNALKAKMPWDLDEEA